MKIKNSAPVGTVPGTVLENLAALTTELADLGTQM